MVYTLVAIWVTISGSVTHVDHIQAVYKKAADCIKAESNVKANLKKENIAGLMVECTEEKIR